MGMEAQTHAWAWTLVAFGVAKIALGVFSLTPPSRWASRVDAFLRRLVGADGTGPGRVLHEALIVFGAYSLVHGLGLLGTPGMAWAATDAFSVASVLCMGTFMAAYFGRVVFKEPRIDSAWRYELFGVGGGLAMLTGLALHRAHGWVVFALLGACAAVTVDAIRRYQGENASAAEAATLLTYPLLSTI